MSGAEHQLISLKHTAKVLAVDLRQMGDEESLHVAARLEDSVIRPLDQVGQLGPNGLGPAAGRHEERVGTTLGGSDVERSTSIPLSDRIWELAQTSTELLASAPGLAALGEATAALQDLALNLADKTTSSTRLADLEEMQAQLAQRIQVVKDGPYLVTNARGFYSWLGESLPLRPQMALCRCGQSRIKPFCDGTHASIGFTDVKDPNRVPDRRDTYVGQQVTILDNRGLCQHSGYCTDRLSTVFRVDKEPFVAPSGGRMDEIIRAVRDCPSGALSYAIDGVEARADTDYHGTRQPAITVTKDGPYRITGDIPLHDSTGKDVARNQGASLEHYALCRCGHSKNKPFCSGAHWYVDFHDPVQDTDHEPTVFEWAGGYPALLRMTRFLYEKHIPADPLLAPVFADMAPDQPERLAGWLSEVFGGPRWYSSKYGDHTHMISQHLGRGLTEEMRRRWVQLLMLSAQDARLPDDPEFRSVFSSYIEWESRLVEESSTTGRHLHAHMSAPRWDWNTAAGPPASRVSSIAPGVEKEVLTMPSTTDDTLHFDQDIKPLFRQLDRHSMLAAFDLWSYDDVSKHADAILARVRSGTMPCDGAWPEEKVDLFHRWVESGKPR